MATICDVVCGDCVREMRALPAGGADMVFADPPYGIGYKYDQYDDVTTPDDYLSWCNSWISEIFRILKPGGAAWVMQAARHVAGTKEISTQTGRFTLRNWIVWRYTFGQAQRDKFTPSWVSMLYMVKPGGRITFNADAVRVASARQTVYHDKRANPLGKLPDDVWDDIPRLCGTHRERVAHPCQLPEALLERAILATTNPGDMIVDPFAGSGTTLVVAKKHGRNCAGIELSQAYCDIIRRRLANTEGPQ